MSRTNSIGGILSVQEQLDSIQSQIEQYQAQLNLLNSETTYATLTVSLSETGHHVIAHKHPATGVDKAWHESLHGFAAGFEWLIRIAGPLLFALLVLAALLALGRLTWRATERRRSRIN
jgi:frataxin-like iron-binding protein CyaY